MVPCVPTGMKAGVSKGPWAVAMRATREFDCESVERIWKRRDICIEIVGFGLVDGHWWGAVERFWAGEVDWVESFFFISFDAAEAGDTPPPPKSGGMGGGEGLEEGEGLARDGGAVP